MEAGPSMFGGVIHHAHAIQTPIFSSPSLGARVPGLSFRARFSEKPPKTRIAPTLARHWIFKRKKSAVSPYVTFDLLPLIARNLTSEDRMIAAKCTDFEVLNFWRFDVYVSPYVTLQRLAPCAAFSRLFACGPGPTTRAGEAIMPPRTTWKPA